jgi:hypothetical protein
MAVFRTADNPVSRTHSHDVRYMVDVFPRDLKTITEILSMEDWVSIIAKK